jgi:hypothetical protein
MGGKATGLGGRRTRRFAAGDEQGPAAGRVRLDVENCVVAPTRVQTIPKGAFMMVISARFSTGTDGYEESND